MCTRCVVPGAACQSASSCRDAFAYALPQVYAISELDAFTSLPKCRLFRTYLRKLSPLSSGNLGLEQLI